MTPQERRDKIEGLKATREKMKSMSEPRKLECPFCGKSLVEGDKFCCEDLRTAWMGIAGLPEG
jgi:hypothetical protein